jgi:ribosomal protein L11 methyltransferase
MRLVSQGRWPPNQIIRELGRCLKIRKNQVQQAIRELVAAGELVYTFEHGRTFIEPSFDRPVRVARHIVLSPPGREFLPGPGDVVIRIISGAAFGAGRHPTTRLALRGVEFVLTHCEKTVSRRMLDIGTGSGVLALAAVKLGIESGIGIDLDPCAVAEAKANVRLNALEGRIDISDVPAESLGGSFALITANLRLPTLLRLAPALAGWACLGSAVVASGLRTEEKEPMLSAFAKQSFRLIWCEAQGDWLGLALQKTNS